MAAVDIPIHPPRFDQPAVAFVDYDICSPLSGRVTSVDFLEFIKSHPDVHECETHVKLGQIVKGYDTGVPQWLGSFRVVGEPDQLQRLINLVHSLVAEIKYPIEPVAPTTKVAHDQETPSR